MLTLKQLRDIFIMTTNSKTALNTATAPQYKVMQSMHISFLLTTSQQILLWWIEHVTYISSSSQREES